HSNLTCGLERAELSIPKGKVRYRDGLTDFSISGRGLNIESVQNFTKSPVGGFATFTSELKGSDKEPLTFKAQTFLEKATLYGFKARSLRGEWGINSDAVFGEDIRADL